MKAKDLILKIVNEIDKGKYEILEFKPYMAYESFIGCILADAEILLPTGIKDKNRNMIYQGDYLCVNGKNGKDEDYRRPVCVEFNKDKGKWCLYREGYEKFEIDDFDSGSYLIIGNKYTGGYL